MKNTREKFSSPERHRRGSPVASQKIASKNQTLFDDQLDAILTSGLSNKIKIIKIGALLSELKGYHHSGVISKQAMTNQKIMEVLPEALRKKYVNEKKRFFQDEFEAATPLITRIQKIARGFVTRMQIAKEKAAETTLANEKSGATLSKTAIALISLSLVAVGAAVASYLTIPAAAAAINLAASWMLVTALPNAAAFFMSKTGIVTLAVIATAALCLIAVSCVAQQAPNTGPSRNEVPTPSKEVEATNKGMTPVQNLNEKPDMTQDKTVNLGA